MLEPLTAIALASSIVQFVDFGSKLLTAGYGAYKSAEGAGKDSLKIEAVYSDLEKLTDRLDGASVAFNFTPSEDELALKDLCSRCRDLAKELLAVLKALKVEGKGILRAWDALRKEIKRNLKADKIENLQDALRSIRSEISVRLLNIVRNNQSDLQMTLRTLTDESKRRHIETLASIANTRDDAIAAIQLLASQVKDLSTSSKIMQDANTWAYQRLENSLSQLDARLNQLGETSVAVATSHRILESLLYPEIKARDVNIDEAYQGTYGWIYDHTCTSFTAWLEGPAEEDSQRLFWFQGKAGSGKSTLMRFVENHPKTKAALSEWANGEQLITASFYFWNSGSQLQRSQEGLLRSLLFQLLRRYPTIIPLVFSKRWNVDSFSQRHPDPWSTGELLGAIRGALDELHKATKAKMCLFIDGLDEFEDKNKDQYTVVKLVRLLTSYAQVKVCVASRPWKIFRVEFADLNDWQIELQSLTETDMMKYTRGMFTEDPRYGKRLMEEPKLDKIVADIQQRASGVFLWVHLVVNSLLRGLSAGDDLETLHERLKALPTDLKSYFRRILEGIDEAYQSEAARVLLLVGSLNLPLMLGAFCFVKPDQQDERFAFNKELEPTNPETLRKWLDLAADRIQNWCKDLVDVKPVEPFIRHAVEISLPGPLEPIAVEQWPSPERECFNRELVPLHRTVRDFLQDTETQSLLQKYAGLEFRAEYAFQRWCLCWLRVLDRKIATSIYGDHMFFVGFVFAILYVAGLREVEGHSSTDLIDELDRTCSQWGPVLETHASNADQRKIEQRMHWSVFSGLLGPESALKVSAEQYSMLTCASVLLLEGYLRSKLNEMTDAEVQHVGTSIFASIHWGLLLIGYNGKVDQDSWIKIVQILTERNWHLGMVPSTWHRKIAGWWNRIPSDGRDGDSDSTYDERIGERMAARLCLLPPFQTNPFPDAALDN